MAKKKTRRINHALSPLDELRSVAHKSPAKDTGKSTVTQATPRDIQAVENKYLFSAKQRPTSWVYFQRTVYEPLLTTGASFTDSVPASVPLVSLDVNECLLINYIEAKIVYKPIPEGTAVADIQGGYYVELDSPLVPVGTTIGSAINQDVGFLFNMETPETALYNVSGGTEDTASVSFRKDRSAPLDGFYRLNENVLMNGDSSTTVYVFEPGDVSMTYTCVDSASGSGNVPRSLLPYGLEWTIPLADQRIGPLVVFNIRGHIITRKDADALRDILRSDNILSPH